MDSQSQRRQSVSDLNLEEILLAMADTEHKTHSVESTQRVGRSNSRPLPTPRAREKKPEKSPRPQSMPTNNDYFYEQYYYINSESPYYQPMMMHPDNGEVYDNGYQQQQQPQQQIYYDNQNYYNINNRHSMYEQTAAYNSNNPYDYYYEYESTTPPIQDIHYDYYNNNPAHYYPHQSQPLLHSQLPQDYYYYDPNQQYNQYDYNYLTEPGYDNQYYYQASPAIYTNSNLSTPRKPLPRLPSKKKRDDLGHHLTFGTPPIASSHHLGLFPHQNDSPNTEMLGINQWMDNNISMEIENERGIDTNNNNKQEENGIIQERKVEKKERKAEKAKKEYEENEILDLEEADSQENLDALLADITLKVTEENLNNIANNNKGIAKTLHTSTVLEEKMNNFNKLRMNNGNDNNNNNNNISHKETGPGSPLPPPRLSKEKASKRLTESYLRSPKPFLTLNQSKDFSPIVPSPLSDKPQIKNPILKVKESFRIGNNNNNQLNNKVFKRNSSKFQPIKVNNCIQLLSASVPVIDKEADGFDFDESDFEEIDVKVQTIKYNKQISIEELVNQNIVVGLKYDWQKIRAIFTWITNNIHYDNQSPINLLDSSDEENNNSDEENNNNSENNNSDNSSSSNSDSLNSEDEDEEDNNNTEYSESAKAVLIRGSCKKFGFANLFKAMIYCAGLECEVIEGVLKDPNNAYDLDKTPVINHAWNSVKIQGYYRLIDCGLAVSTHIFNLSKKLDQFYFLTNPSKMIFTHFPILEKYQYLKPTITYSLFQLLPFATSHFFDYGIKMLDLPESLITVNEDETGELNLMIPQDMQCSAEIETIEFKNNSNFKKFLPLVQCKSRENGRYCKIMIRIKGKENRAILKVRCGYPKESSKYQLPFCFSIKLEHNGHKSPEEFVKLLPSPKQFFIIEPVNFDLLYNINYRFHVLPSILESYHFKLALRSPSMKIHKFVYYPGDQGYVANVTLRERGQWAISYMVENKQERASKRDPWINVACYRCI
ncbi:hypothetical protein K502DRAFT_362833 [Neoconidiobolus thromboides FSU 785]|nr:hypothetical protein K502DRAFT_362833 [Neoconidiobolus thromboides FSU 785]